MTSTTALHILPGITANLDLMVATVIMSVTCISGLIERRAHVALDRRPSVVSRTLTSYVSWLAALIAQPGSRFLTTRTVALQT